MKLDTLSVFIRRKAAFDESDEALLRRFVETRCSDTFSELVRRYGSAVYGVCRRALGDHHLAEDAVQSVFVVLARKASSIHPPSAVGGWLYGVARKAAAEARAMRRRKCREALPGDLPERSAFAPEPDDTAALVDAEIADLPVALRSVVVLCEIGGVSRTEAAVRLGIAPGTLSSRLAKARRVLGQRLRRRGVHPAVVSAVALPPSLARAAAGCSDGLASGTILELSDGVMQAMLITTARLTSVAVVFAALATGAVFSAPSEPPITGPPIPRSNDPGERVSYQPAPAPARRPEWKELFVLKHKADVTAVAASSEMVAVADAGCQLRLWGATDGKELTLEIRGARSLVPADLLWFTANDQYLILSSPSGLVTRYEQRAGGMVGDSTIFDGYVPLATSADLNTLVTRKVGNPGVVCLHDNVWAVPRNALRPSAGIELPDEVRFTHVALSADDRRLTVACDDGVLRVYDRISLKELIQIKLKKGQKLSGVRLSEDGKRLAAVGESGFARVFDTDTGTELCMLNGHDGNVSAIAFSPDGKRVATANGKVARVFDAKSGKSMGELAGHVADVTAITFSTDGKRLVTGSADKTARVWEPKE
jgi:RNA polymerase sigma factor (sigma-70 family)